MRIPRYAGRFCADSGPHWTFFFCFIFFNILVVYTLYTRQPERYRHISRWLSAESRSTHSLDAAKAAVFTVPGGGPGPGVARVWNGLTRAPNARGRIVEFAGMTLSNAAAKQVRKRESGADRYGVEVVSIDKTGVPYLSGVRKGDVIVSVNRMPTYTVADFEQVTRHLDTSQGILFDMYRNGRFYYITIEMRNAVRW